MSLIVKIHENIAGCSSVVDNGNGAFTAHIDGQGSRAVTDAEILSAAQEEKLEAIRSDAKARIEAAYPPWRQSNAALGLLPQAYVATMITDIAAVIAASNAAEDAVDAVTLVAGLAAALAAIDGVTPVWP